MSTQLEQLGIALEQGYDQRHVDPDLDCVVVGNALSRGQAGRRSAARLRAAVLLGPAVARRERAARQVGARGLGHARQDDDHEHARVDPRVRGPRSGLPDRRRSRATSASRRGSAARSTSSSRPTSTTRRSSTSARSSCTTGRARWSINNIEYDHADIYRGRRRDPLAVPSAAAHGAAQRPDRRERPRRERRASCCARGVWTPRRRRSAHATRGATGTAAYDSIGEQSRFSVARRGAAARQRALAAARRAQPRERARGDRGGGARRRAAPTSRSRRSREFKGVKRRLEQRGTFGGIALYEDFAHHPTAIATTLAGLQEPRRRETNRRRHGAALEHDAHGRAPRHAGRLVRRRRSRVRARRQRRSAGTRPRRSRRSARGSS